jgi:outer membrane receptor protein involved in Fe transport
MRFSPTALRCTVALAALVAPATLCAQTATPAAAPREDMSSDLSATEVVVTAQKREESLQSVPIAITAFTAAALEDKTIDDSSDLSFSVPNLTVTDSGASLRGIGNLAISSTSESGLGYHVNGVYIGAPATAAEYFDIERIEVLRGPQGTLYGRNTTAGVINIITQKPTDDFGGYLFGSYGNYNSVKLKGALNVPVGDALAFRVAGFFLDREGYTTNIFNGNKVDDRHMYNLRGSVRLDLGDTRADLVVGYFRENDSRNNGTKGVCKKDALVGCSPLERGFETPDSRRTIFNTLRGLTGLFPAGDYFANSVNPTSLRQINQDIDPQVSIKEWNASLELQHDFGNVTLTSLSGYQQLRADTRNDFDRFVSGVALSRPITFDLFRDGNRRAYNSIVSARRDQVESRQYYQEVRLASDFGGAFDFLIGGNYYDYRSDLTVDITHVALAATQQQFGLNPAYEAYRIESLPSTTKSYGFFGELYFDLSEATRLTGGLRYSHDKKFIATRQLFLDPLFNPTGYPTPNSIVPFTIGRFEKGTLTGRVVLDHKFSDRVLGYVSASRGYKAGGINPGGATTPTFDPEFVNAGEVGLKGTTRDGTFSANGAVFYYDYKGLQVGQVGVTSANTVNSDAKVYGAEVEFVVRPISAFQFDGSVSYLNTRISNFTSGDEGDPNAITPGAVVVRDGAGNPVRNAGGVIIKDLSGNDLPFSPTWKFAVGLQYRIALPGGASLTPRIDHYQQGEYFGTAFNKPIDRFPGYSQTDLKLLFRPAGGRWDLRAFAKNAFNNDDVIRLGQEGPLVGRFRSLTILEPRTYGLEATVRF